VPIKNALVVQLMRSVGIRKITLFVIRYSLFVTL